MNHSFHLLKHPALQHKLAILRDRRTSSAEVRRIINEVSTLLAYEATRHLSVHLPLVVSILRAGNSMLEGVLAILCEAKVGHIGIYRDRLTKSTVEYYFRLPDKGHVQNKEVLLIDPLVATGDTILASIERLQQFGVGAISVLCLLISQEALQRVQHFYPEVQIYTLGMEETLDDQGVLIPGIGDISSRLYGWVAETDAI